MEALKTLGFSLILSKKIQAKPIEKHVGRSSLHLPVDCIKVRQHGYDPNDRRSGFMKQGVLIYDTESERMDVRFGLEEYYGGLHCGTCMDVFVGNRWKPTRIEYDWGDKGWYLVGIPTSSISGLRVRIA